MHLQDVRGYRALPEESSEVAGVTDQKVSDFMHDETLIEVSPSSDIDRAWRIELPTDSPVTVRAVPSTNARNSEPLDTIEVPGSSEALFGLGVPSVVCGWRIKRLGVRWRDRSGRRAPNQEDEAQQHVSHDSSPPLVYRHANTPANLEEAAASVSGLQQMLRMTASRKGQKEPSPARVLPQSPLSLTTEADPPPRALSSEPPPLGVGIRVERVHPVFTTRLPGSVTQRPETVSETACSRTQKRPAHIGCFYAGDGVAAGDRHAQGVSIDMFLQPLFPAAESKLPPLSVCRQPSHPVN